MVCAGILILVMTPLLFEEQGNSLFMRVSGLLIVILGFITLCRGRAENGKEMATKRLRFCENILREEPMNIPALFEKTSALMELERFREAMECLNQVLEINPGNAEARKLREQCNTLLREKDKK